MNAPLLPGRIEHWPLARLRSYVRNAKAHDADQVTKIVASMAEFSWTVPCLVAADGELIAGHGRVLAAAKLGLAEAPVIVLGHLTEAQRRAYRIADTNPATPVEPITRHGDLWALGDHRLICGDATDQCVVARLPTVGDADTAYDRSGLACDDDQRSMGQEYGSQKMYVARLSGSCQFSSIPTTRGL